MNAPSGILTKQQQELRVFELLAPHIVTVDPGSIQQPAPPAPDIQCTVEGAIRHYELVALDDDQTRTRLKHMVDTRQAWDRAIQRRSAPDQTAFAAECADMWISVNFKELAGQRDRMAAFGKLQDFLLASRGFAGRVPEAHLTDDVERAEIHRQPLQAPGPHIMAPSAGYWSPPNVDTLVQKLTAKRYTVSGPLELIAYSVHDEPNGSVTSLQSIEACVRSHIGSSPFSAVHVFHFGFNQHIATYHSADFVQGSAT